MPIFCRQCEIGHEKGTFCPNCGSQLINPEPEDEQASRNPTTFENKCKILTELWINYRDHEDFEDFVEFNDISLPLAYLISNGIVESSSKAEEFINETWVLLLEELCIPIDNNFKDLASVI
jgi:hypothetical protein